MSCMMKFPHNYSETRHSGRQYIIRDGLSLSFHLQMDIPKTVETPQLRVETVRIIYLPGVRSQETGVTM